MPDLSVVVVQRFGRQPVMPPASVLLANLDMNGGEAVRVAEALTLARTLETALEEPLVPADLVTAVRV